MSDLDSKKSEKIVLPTVRILTMSDSDIREESENIVRARLLDLGYQLVQATEKYTTAKNLLEEAKAKIPEEATKEAESCPAPIQDEWDEWDEPVTLPNPNLKLEQEVEKFKKIADDLNKDVIKARKDFVKDVNREVSLLKGKKTQAENIAREQAIRAEDQAEKDRLEALRVAQQEEEARRIKAEEERKKVYYDSLPEAERIRYDEAQEKAALEEEKRKFIAKHMADNGWNDEERGYNRNNGRTCVSGKERTLKNLAEADWIKELERQKRDASRAQFISRPISTFQRENCKFPTCFKPGCNFLHTLTQCASTRRERCVYYENCGNKRCTDLHTYKFIESSEP